MADLLVRDVEQSLVQALELRAQRSGRTIEQEHRAILVAVLSRELPSPGFKELLLAMPDVGEDSDFEREQDYGRDVVL